MVLVSELPHLKHLNLSHNLISHIDRWVHIQTDKTVRILIKFLIFRTAFDNLSNLRQLSLSHNQLGSLEKQLLEPLVNLEILLLDHNYLEDINEVFLVLGNLKYISLVHNSVKWFDVAFFPKSVESINLSKNMIEESRLNSIINIFFILLPNKDTFLYNIRLIPQKVKTLAVITSVESGNFFRKLEIILNCWRVSLYTCWISVIIEFSAWKQGFLWWEKWYILFKLNGLKKLK